VSRSCRPGRDGTRASGPAAPEDSGPPDSGMVTAELAVAFPVLVLAALLAVAGVQVVSAQLRCLDAAGVAARLAARGELTADVESVAHAAAPPDARLTLSRTGDVVSAAVAARVHPLGLGALLPAFSVEASAVAPMEPGQPGR